jgi:micrococcal nuclease
MADPVVTVSSYRVNKSLTPVLPTEYCGTCNVPLKKWSVIMAAFVLLVLLPGFGESAAAGPRGIDEIAARVVRVNDGDTVTVSINGRRQKIRLIGIDAPEIGQGSWGEKAKRHLAEIISSSRSVFVEFDVERTDKYGRLLAYVKATDGRSVNAEMLRDGYAVLFTFPPNVKHVEEFIAAQRQARQLKRGIWGKDGLSQLPVDWRKQHPRR